MQSQLNVRKILRMRNEMKCEEVTREKERGEKRKIRMNSNKLFKPQKPSAYPPSLNPSFVSNLSSTLLYFLPTSIRSTYPTMESGLTSTLLHLPFLHPFHFMTPTIIL